MTAAEKRTDFLWIVQMILIKHLERIEGWPGIAGDAVAASYRIPGKMSARDAARGFCACYVKGFNGDTPAECPDWMTELKDPI